MKQKGFAPILVLILIALAVIGYFGYKNYWPKLQNLVTTSPTPTASQVPAGDLTNWKTYTSNKYNISFKYPSYYQVKEVEVGSNEFYSNGIFVYDTKNKVPEMGGDKLIAPAIIKISYEPDFNKLCPEKTCTKKEIIKVGNNQFMPFSEGMPLAGFYSNDIMVLSLQSNVDENDPIFSQILSTFKFLDQDASQFCGGFAGVACPKGYSCKLDGKYPDAGGVCIKN